MKSVINGRDIKELDWNDLVDEVVYAATLSEGCSCYNPEQEYERRLRALLEHIRQMPPMADREKNR